MEEHEFTESREFPAPFVRVRGRLSREWQVQWSPSLRTYKGPPDKPVPGSGNNRTAVSQNQFAVDFLDYQGKVLESLPTVPHFLAKDQEWATFVTRLPYHSATQSVRLRFGEREISVLPVPTDRPFFSLLHPGEDSFIDDRGVLHLHWCDQVRSETPYPSRPAASAQAGSAAHLSFPVNPQTKPSGRCRCGSGHSIYEVRWSQMRRLQPLT